MSSINLSDLLPGLPTGSVFENIEVNGTSLTLTLKDFDKDLHRNLINRPFYSFTKLVDNQVQVVFNFP